MLFEHADHPGRGVRLAYCMNLHPASDLEGVLEGMRTITLPLAERLGATRSNSGFGVGMWLPADVALALAVPDGAADLARLTEFLQREHLDPFTFNAFPYRGFHDPGLKEKVFMPSWKSPERLSYTLAVASIARALREAQGGTAKPRHVSISTHTGMFGALIEGEQDRLECADNVALCALGLAQLEEESGLRVVLGLEPEPRSLANDTGGLPAHFERIRVRAREVLGRGFEGMHDLSETIVREHVGTCLDTCHAAVEFEPPETALANATSAGTPLAKIQFSSALALEQPARNHEGRELVFRMAEPVYLHQVTGRVGGEQPRLVRAGDLPELQQCFEAGEADWREAEEWRCHFHVPVDLAELGAHGIATTRSQADELLDLALRDPGRWGTRELHLEIETYTWDVLPAAARGPGDVVDGLEREYEHVLGRLGGAGWKLA